MNGQVERILTLVEKLESQGEKVIILDRNRKYTTEELKELKVISYTKDLLQTPCLIFINIEDNK